ncbi:MAG: hypothetical protein AMJ81_13175 [Phycisphaerae bacterium SM23_33]|nr:MAG: hypothetical protein AMJ81_13175 [Phycisphaerae bacterium SM23_33]
MNTLTQAKRIHFVQAALPRWYRRRRRDLPWRGRRDPYVVWVAEIMLQQTRAATAGPYFERFCRRFPDIAALARAPLDSVLKAWEGLGYYGRARNLHRAARRVVGEFGGRLPGTAQQLLKLPGIGRYTAGAVASIAFGADEPVLDGNVSRVLCRLFAVGTELKAAATQKRLWSLARRMIPPGEAGAFNQALMDLGATVCLPRSPQCPACPLKKICLAHARNRQQELPRRSPPRRLPHQTIVAGVIRKAGRVLIGRRPEEGLLGGLWEFPGGKVEKGETLTAALRREVREEVGIRVRVAGPLMTLRHAYSHFRITLHVFECRRLAGRAMALGCAAVRWVRPPELGRYAFPAANRKIIAALRRQAGAAKPRLRGRARAQRPAK